ncbi:hypothetical protein Tco_0300855 [Tanacetum coccineum]
MASMNTRLNIKKLDGNIVQKHGGSKQVGFKQLGPGIETGVHGVHDEKRVWFEVELQGAQGAREVEVFQVSNDDTIVAQRWLEDKQPEEKTNTDCLVYTTMYEEWGRQTFGCCSDTTSESVGTGSMQALHGDEFEVEPQDGHTFEVKPHGNVDHVVASQEVQTQDLIYYHPARDREQHSVWELFSIEKTVSCEVISKWKAGLKDDMDARSDVLRSRLPRVCWLKQREIYLVWRSSGIRVGSLLGDCDVEKNGKWSCIYAVGSQEYQMVCTRLDIASADVESGYELSLVAGIATGALVKGGSRSEVPA